MIQAGGEQDIHVQNRLLHFEDYAQAIDQLFRSALAARGNNAFYEFLDFVSREPVNFVCSCLIFQNSIDKVIKKDNFSL